MKRLELQNTNRPVDVINHWHRAGYLDLSPPYQRGDVWGHVRRQNFIKSLLMGVPIASLIINDRSRHPEWGYMETGFLAVIDGKQRMTSVLMFMDNELSVPGEWFGITVFPRVKFGDLSASLQRRFKNTPLPFAEGSLRNLTEETEVFELVNYGGVPQGESDA